MPEGGADCGAAAGRGAVTRFAPAAAALIGLAGAAEARKPCPPAEDQYIAALLVSVGGDVALFIAAFKGPMSIAHVECLAKRGDKAMLLELGRRYDTGVGARPDPERAEQLYSAAARSVSGTTAIYVPGVGKSPGHVQMIRTGPDVPGLPEGTYQRALMHIEGRARKPSFRKGIKLLKQAAKRGYAPAAEKLRQIENEPKV
jgi:TPR repeat protein